MKKHIKVMRALRKDEIDDINIPKTLNYAYFLMAKNYYKMFLRTKLLSKGRAAKKYFQICDDSDFNSKCARFLERVEKKIEKVKMQKYRYQFFVFAGNLLFQDELQLTEDETNKTTTLLADNSSLCYGAGLRRQNSFKGFELAGCVFSGTATVQNDGGFQNYAQSGIPIAGLLVEAAYFYRFDEEKIRLGLALPLMYRAGSYSEQEGFTISEIQTFYYGLVFNAGIQLPFNFELQTKLGQMAGTSLLSLNLNYNF